MTSSVASAAHMHSLEHREAARVVAASHVLSITGVLFLALAVFAPDALARLFQLAASGDTVATTDSAARLGAALFGSLTLGWGVTLQRLGHGTPLKRATLIGAIVWFVFDSAASMALGYGWNALSNLGFLVLIIAILHKPPANDPPLASRDLRRNG